MYGMSMNLAGWRNILKRFMSRGVYPQELAFLLDNPLRHFILSPRQLADILRLPVNATVLEIGPGPGYFSVEVARRIPNGQLVLLDIQPEMLIKSRRKLERAGLTNFHVVEGSATCLPFGPHIFDAVFLVSVLGEISQPKECLNCLGRVVRRGGLLSVTEMRGDPDALPQSEVLDLSETGWFELQEKRSFPCGFTLNFRKVENWAGASNK
jgi:ubiquinone/menaquinone biosynthesis C-methylase UbiE